MTPTDTAMPELPEAAGVGIKFVGERPATASVSRVFAIVDMPAYTAEQMHAYAQAHAASLQARVDAAEADAARWKAFAQHCQSLVGAIKVHMTAEQQVAWLTERIDAGIVQLGSQDTSDIDPELLDFAREMLAARHQGEQP